jgi:hypothetical protein
MEGEARVAAKPGQDFRVLVGGVVVQHHMDVFSLQRAPAMSDSISFAGSRC